MTIQRFLAAIAIVSLISGAIIAQGTQPAYSEAAAKTAPKTTPKATTPVTEKVNLNTANAQELDKLPQIGPARAKAIIDARAKGTFKSWDDFVARKVVPANAERAIKDLVIF
jgi:competence protein ComEA